MVNGVLEIVTLTQVVNKFPAFLEKNRMFIDVFKKSSTLL